MAKQFPALEPKHAEFIAAQQVFFTGSAAATGRVNVSPKGMDALRILTPNRVCYMDLTGSGNETAAHSRADGRLTVMFCAFAGPPQILRLYGSSAILRRGESEYQRILSQAFGGTEIVGARQIVVLDVDLVQTSCGYAVPLFDYREERPTLVRWAEAQEKGEGLDAYRRENNLRSIDGFPTGMVEGETEAAE
jgi:Pyridoxamine 5'-phosphate oxidase